MRYRYRLVVTHCLTGQNTSKARIWAHSHAHHSCCITEPRKPSHPSAKHCQLTCVCLQQRTRLLHPLAAASITCGLKRSTELPLPSAISAAAAHVHAAAAHTASLMSSPPTLAPVHYCEGQWPEPQASTQDPRPHCRSLQKVMRLTQHVGSQHSVCSRTKADTWLNRSTELHMPTIAASTT